MFLAAIVELFAWDLASRMLCEIVRDYASTQDDSADPKDSG